MVLALLRYLMVLEKWRWWRSRRSISCVIVSLQLYGLVWVIIYGLAVYIA
jgi:hypothetical protein